MEKNMTKLKQRYLQIPELPDDFDITNMEELTKIVKSDYCSAFFYKGELRVFDSFLSDEAARIKETSPYGIEKDPLIKAFEDQILTEGQISRKYAESLQKIEEELAMAQLDLEAANNKLVLAQNNIERNLVLELVAAANGKILK